MFRNEYSRLVMSKLIGELPILYCNSYSKKIYVLISIW